LNLFTLLLVFKNIKGVVDLNAIQSSPKCPPIAKNLCNLAGLRNLRHLVAVKYLL